MAATVGEVALVEDELREQVQSRLKRRFIYTMAAMVGEVAVVEDELHEQEHAPQKLDWGRTKSRRTEKWRLSKTNCKPGQASQGPVG